MSTQTKHRFEAKRLQLSRELQLKILIERELAKRNSDERSAFSVLLNVRLTALLPIKYLENLDRQLAYTSNVPILVAALKQEGSAATADSSWAARGSKIEACVAAYWEHGNGRHVVRRLLEPRGLPCVGLTRLQSTRHQRDQILSAMDQVAKSGGARIPMNSLSQSQRNLLAGPQTSISSLLEFQLLSKAWLLQEPNLGTIVCESSDAKLTGEERYCIRHRALDWVALRPVEIAKGHSSKYWTPYLVIEFDGPNHEDQTTLDVDQIKDRILTDAGLSVLRCSYKDFPQGNGAASEQQFRSQFVIHALLRLRASHREEWPFVWPYTMEEGLELEAYLTRSDRQALLTSVAHLADSQAVETVWRQRGGYRYVELHAQSGTVPASTKVLGRSPLLRTEFATSSGGRLPNEFFEAFAEEWVLQQYISKMCR